MSTINTELELKNFINNHYKIYEEVFEKDKQELTVLNMVLTALSTNAIYDIESIFTLVKYNKINGSNSLTRNLIEKYLYIRLILEENSDVRASDFLIANESMLVEILEESIELFKSNVKENLIKELKSYKKNKYSHKKQKWFVNKNIESIVGIANHLQDEQAEFYYLKYSGEIHSKDLFSKLSHSQNNNFDYNEVVAVSSYFVSKIIDLLINHFNLNSKFNLTYEDITYDLVF